MNPDYARGARDATRSAADLIARAIARAESSAERMRTAGLSPAPDEYTAEVLRPLRAILQRQADQL